MPFEPGDHVHVRALGKGTVREVRRGGRVLVDIKGHTLLVPLNALSPVEDRKPVSKHRPERPTSPPLPSRTWASSSIDLHGMTTDQAIGALDAFVSDAMLAGLAEVRVIHGRSGGRLKAAVHARLGGISSVRAFRLDPTNPGVTIVTL